MMRTQYRTMPDTGRSTANIALAAGAGVAAGIAANMLRKAVFQAPTAMAGGWNEALAAEHDATLALFDKLEETDSSQTTRRTMLLMQVKRALSKHAFQEENVIYPLLRDHDEKEAADRFNNDHGYVKQYLYDLGMMSRNDMQWMPKLREFRALLERHMNEEENEIFPRLRSRLSEEENRKATLAMNKEGLKLA